MRRYLVRSALAGAIIAALGFTVSSHREHLSRSLGDAAEAGDVARVSSLLRWRWYLDLDRRAPLSRAAEEGHAEVVELLMDAGATFDGLDLSDAAGEGHLEVVALLIDAGLDPNESVSPLVNAASSGHTEIVRFLLEAGAEVNRGYARGGTSRLGAAIGNALGYVVHGNINGRMSATPGNATYHPEALHSAIVAGQLEAAALLIDAGANVLEDGRLGLRYGNAVDLAREHGDADMVELLEAAPELPMGINVLNAAQRGDWERMSRVVALGADVNELEWSTDPDSAGWTALMFAAEAGRVDMVVLLLDRGADVNNASWAPEPESALSIATANGHEEIVELLVQAGATAD